MTIHRRFQSNGLFWEPTQPAPPSGSPKNPGRGLKNRSTSISNAENTAYNMKNVAKNTPPIVNFRNLCEKVTTSLTSVIPVIPPTAKSQILTLTPDQFRQLVIYVANNPKDQDHYHPETKKHIGNPVNKLLKLDSEEKLLDYTDTDLELYIKQLRDLAQILSKDEIHESLAGRINSILEESQVKDYMKKNFENSWWCKLQETPSKNLVIDWFTTPYTLSARDDGKLTLTFYKNRKKTTEIISEFKEGIFTLESGEEIELTPTKALLELAQESAFKEDFNIFASNSSFDEALQNTTDPVKSCLQLRRLASPDHTTEDFQKKIARLQKYPFPDKVSQEIIRATVSDLIDSILPNIFDEDQDKDDVLEEEIQSTASGLIDSILPNIFDEDQHKDDVLEEEIQSTASNLINSIDPNSPNSPIKKLMQIVDIDCTRDTTKYLSAIIAEKLKLITNHYLEIEISRATDLNYKSSELYALAELNALQTLYHVHYYIQESLEDD